MVSVKEKGYDHRGGTFVFCPNCGTQNESAATPCKKCGFKLSGISVPKFKGTMVMNSDQTVAEMIEEHRKRQVQAGPADKTKARASEPAPRRNPGSSAPPSSTGAPRGPVLQPPRVAAPTRGRMGGTMLGVAPQVGGYSPPGGVATPPAATPSPDPSSAAPSQTETESFADEAAFSPPAPPVAEADPFAGTVEQARHEPEAAPSDATPEPANAAARTRPSPEAQSDDYSAQPEAGHDPAPEPAAASIEAAPAAPRAVPVTAPLPRVPEASESESQRAKGSALVESKPSPARLRPLDIVLIVCTFGIYGLVLWAKQRKPPT